MHRIKYLAPILTCKMNRGVILFFTIVSSALLVTGDDKLNTMYADSYRVCNEKFNVKDTATVNDFPTLLYAITKHPNDVKCYVDCIFRELHFLTDAGFDNGHVSKAVTFYSTKSEKMSCKFSPESLQKCFDTANAVATADPTDKECARTGTLMKCLITNYTCP